MLEVGFQSSVRFLERIEPNILNFVELLRGLCCCPCGGWPVWCFCFVDDTKTTVDDGIS